MKRSLLFVLLCVAISSYAQLQGPPDGANQKARVTQWVGPVEISITYSSPDVHDPSGKDRTGQIWGKLAHYGFIDQGFGTSKAAPWRAGANENTTISFSHDVKIGGTNLKAGTYGLFLDLEESGPWNWIFSRNANAWGSYFYDPKDDAARVQTTPEDAPYTEWLTYGFDDRQPNSTVAYLQWEKKRIPFKIEVPNVNEIYVANMQKQLAGTPLGFGYEGWRDAAQFCADNKVALEQGLIWAEAAISSPFVGQENFSTLRTKAAVYRAMGRIPEAQALMDKAIKMPAATVQEIHAYGRGLLAAGETQKALDVFKYNMQKHPEEKFTTFVGMARGSEAVGDKKNAIKYWETAIKNIPENQKQFLPQYQAELDKLKK